MEIYIKYNPANQTVEVKQKDIVNPEFGLAVLDMAKRQVELQVRLAQLNAINHAQAEAQRAQAIANSLNGKILRS